MKHAEPKNVMPINETDYIKSYVVIESIVGITHQIITGLYQHEAVFFLPAASIEYANHQLVSFKFVDKNLNEKAICYIHQHPKRFLG